MLTKNGPVPERLLGILVKEPVAGRVKTRLCPPLQPEESAALYEVALQETVRRFAAELPVVLFHAGDPGYFRERFPHLPLCPQHPGDLGQRMDEALSLLLETGCPRAALIGSDSPDLPVAMVAAAFSSLGDHDAVVVPAEDGGYVLVGTGRPCPELFRDIPWSTAAVLPLTRQRAAAAGLRYREVGGWSDVDDRGSLRLLVERSPASATARFIREQLPHAL